MSMKLIMKKPVGELIFPRAVYHSDLIAILMEDGTYYIHKNKVTEHLGAGISPTLFKGILVQSTTPIVYNHLYISKDEEGNIIFERTSEEDR